jgi:hypothetical protein
MDDLFEVEQLAGQSLVDLLVLTKLAESKNAARRVIQQGGVRLNEVDWDMAVTNVDYAINPADVVNGAVYLMVGKTKSAWVKQAKPQDSSPKLPCSYCGKPFEGHDELHPYLAPPPGIDVAALRLSRQKVARSNFRAETASRCFAYAVSKRLSENWPSDVYRIIARQAIRATDVFLQELDEGGDVE